MTKISSPSSGEAVMERELLKRHLFSTQVACSSRLRFPARCVTYGFAMSCTERFAGLRSADLRACLRRQRYSSSRFSEGDSLLTSFETDADIGLALFAKRRKCAKCCRDLRLMFRRLRPYFVWSSSGHSQSVVMLDVVRPRRDHDVRQTDALVHLPVPLAEVLHNLILLARRKKLRHPAAQASARTTVRPAVRDVPARCLVPAINRFERPWRYRIRRDRTREVTRVG